MDLGAPIHARIRRLLGRRRVQSGRRRCRWAEDLSGYFRNVKPAHEIIRLGHKGWYVNAIHQDETTEGLVLQLPARHGQTLFMAACSDPWNDNSGIVEQYLYDDADTAARSADGLAENYAETCREDDLKQTAERDIEDLQNEIKEARERIRELIAGIRRSTLDTVVCDEMRRSIRRLRSQCESKRARSTKLQEEPECLLY